MGGSSIHAFQGVSFCFLTWCFHHFYSKLPYATDMATPSERRVKEKPKSKLSQWFVPKAPNRPWNSTWLYLVAFRQNRRSSWRVKIYSKWRFSSVSALIYSNFGRFRPWKPPYLKRVKLEAWFPLPILFLGDLAGSRRSADWSREREHVEHGAQLDRGCPFVRTAYV